MDPFLYINKLVEKKDLTLEEIRELFSAVVKGEIDPVQIAAVLIALRIKGESVEEILGLIREMRKYIVSFPRSIDAIDTCGTGGDGSGTFNISTTVAFVVAGAGVKVVKHGNRAASSKCGSADVLSKLGVTYLLTPGQSEEVLKGVGLIFLFAPLYHPVMKQIAPIRQALGTRTVFNFLGPFLNPAQVKRQLIGVPNAELAETLSRVAAQLSYEHLLIVSGVDGMDEIALNGRTTLFEVKGKRVSKKLIDPEKVGFKKAAPEDILGGNAQENAYIIRDILAGKKGAKRDIVVLNAAYALYIAGKIEKISEGIRLAEESIDSGAAQLILETLIKETQKYAK